MDAFTNFLGKVDDIVWGLPLIILIIVCGIYLTIRLKFLPDSSSAKGTEIHD